MSARDVLVVGNLRGAARSALTTAVNGVMAKVTEIAAIDDAMAALEKQPWSAVLVDTTLSGASRFCSEARSHRSLFGIPFIALSPRLTDLAFLNALRWGADDVVALGAAEALGVRLGALLDAPKADVPKERGEAVVADPDRRRGNGLGRAIHNAGYAVRYAVDATSARFYTTKPEIELFIFNADVASPKAFIEEAQQAGCGARWVVLAKAAQVEELQKELGHLKGVVVMTSGMPPENVLFAINLLYPSEASRRGEVRALFGTVVYFRAVGDYRDECGFSYTASPQGLYVRTLSPPPSNKVWIELIPPDGERRVRLVGQVAWTRAYGRSADEPSPPGFGVKIVDGLGEDLMLWSECLKSLEFRAPATLVPEARFSLRAAGVTLPEAPPLSGNLGRKKAPSTTLGTPAFPAPNSPTLTRPALGSTALTGTSLTGTSLNSTAPRRSGDSSDASPAVPSVPLPPLSASLERPSIDRLSAAAKARISTRPSLRLSLSSPAKSQPPTPVKPVNITQTQLPAQLPPVTVELSNPKRVGQGRTVMGLGILQRDGSLVVESRTQIPPPEPNSVSRERAVDPAVAPTEIDLPVAERPSLSPSEREDGVRLSPVTGRTLSYGNQPHVATPSPKPPENKFWAAAEALPSSPDDISDRPTLADRLSFELAEQTAAEALDAESIDSLPPDALESDAPPRSPSLPARRSDRISKTLLAATPVLPLDNDSPTSTSAETDRNWLGAFAVTPAETPIAPAVSIATLPEPTAAETAVLQAKKPSEDLGATLPGVVVDTAMTTTQEAVPSGAPPIFAHTPGDLSETRRPPVAIPAANDDSAEDSDSVASNDSAASSDRTRRVHRTDVMSHTPTVHRAVPSDTSDDLAIPKKRSALWPVLAAVAVASAVIALLIKPSTSPNPQPPASGAAVAAPPSEPSIPPAVAKPDEVTSAQAAESVTSVLEANTPISTVAVVRGDPSSNAPPAGVSPDGASPGSVSPGSVSPGSVSPGSVSPGSVSPGSVSPGSVSPGGVSSASVSPENASPGSETSPGAPPRDPATLAAKNAWVYVQSSLSAQVFLHGVNSGETNTWLETPCGTRFLRLGKSAGDWLSPGVPVVIRCRNANVIQVPAE